MDEEKAHKAWKEYYKAIIKYKLDSIQDGWHQEGDPKGYMYDAFFAGYYAGRDDFKLLDDKILDVLDEIKLSQTGWEGSEDIMTFNGIPIGMTIRKNVEIDRWWWELKRKIAEYLFDEFYSQE